jgi:hypothetical protein
MVVGPALFCLECNVEVIRHLFLRQHFKLQECKSARVDELLVSILLGIYCGDDYCNKGAQS